MSDRYDEKPFLRFVDAYVLDAIGHLDKATDDYCTAMVPSLEKSFGLKGSWRDIVAAKMQFPSDFPQRVQAIWTDGEARFEAAHGRPADPAQFAMIFVDRTLRGGADS